MHLGQKDNGDSLIQAGAIHINSGADGEHEIRDIVGHSEVVSDAFHGDRQGGCT